VNNLIARIKRTSELKTLNELGKALFEHPLGIHAGTIWMHYNARKAELTPELSNKAAEIIDFVKACKTRMKLGKVGKRLYELQGETHQVNGNLAIAETDWRIIWDTYRTRKEEILSNK